jgi:hypothetical protein
MHIANDFVYAVAEKTGSGIDAVSLSANTCFIDLVWATTLDMKMFIVSNWLYQGAPEMF